MKFILSWKKTVVVKHEALQIAELIYEMLQRYKREAKKSITDNTENHLHNTSPQTWQTTSSTKMTLRQLPT